MTAQPWIAVAALLACLLPGPALADEGSVSAATVALSGRRSAYWQRLLDPDATRAARLVREGRALLVPTLALGGWTPATTTHDYARERSLTLESASARFALARTLDPSSREARLMQARTLALAEGFESERARLLAIGELESLRALDPEYEAEEVAFQLGLLHARPGDMAAARREYEHALAMHCDPGKQPTVLLNLAEVTMFQGDLSRALALYERAARESEANGRVLALWGSAVALDRLGERTAALEAARRAMEGDRAPFAALHRAGVFFVPAYELDYYEGVGALALASAERNHGENWSSVISRARRALRESKDAAVIERALHELDRTGMDARVQQSLVSLQQSLPARPSARGPVQTAEQPPASREARALLWLLRARGSFARYVGADGGSGPFTVDASDHLRDLDQALSTQ